MTTGYYETEQTYEHSVRFRATLCCPHCGKPVLQEEERLPKFGDVELHGNHVYVGKRLVARLPPQAAAGARILLYAQGKAVPDTSMTAAMWAGPRRELPATGHVRVQMTKIRKAFAGHLAVERVQHLGYRLHIVGENHVETS